VQGAQHIVSKFVRGDCTGTRFHHICLDQSGIALKAGRAQDYYDKRLGPVP